MRALRNALEANGEDSRSYNVAMGISFSPAGNLNADQLIEAVTKNRKISENLNYSMQAGIRKEPSLNINKASAVEALSKFDEELSSLPQEAGASMMLEFTVSNPHETIIVEAAQKAINAIEEVQSEVIQPGKPKLVQG